MRLGMNDDDAAVSSVFTNALGDESDAKLGICSSLFDESSVSIRCPVSNS